MCGKIFIGEIGLLQREKYCEFVINGRIISAPTFLIFMLKKRVKGARVLAGVGSLPAGRRAPTVLNFKASVGGVHGFEL